MPRPPLEITPDILLRAYAVGLFPMAESADDDSLFWVDPEQRGIFPLDGLTVSRSLGKTLRSERYAVRMDHDFDGVLEGCAEPAPGRPNTWINGRIRALFGALFARGRVHTVEAYAGERLVGGLYGLQIGGAFFGESMFHRSTDASKVCLVHLAARLLAGGFSLLDTQFITPHLASLGAIEIPRAEYRNRLSRAIDLDATLVPAAQMSGAEALTIVRAAGLRAQSRLP